jgi:hypothetical protein
MHVLHLCICLCHLLQQGMHVLVISSVLHAGVRTHERIAG